jgi:hypothetical protein
VKKEVQRLVYDPRTKQSVPVDEHTNPALLLLDILLKLNCACREAMLEEVMARCSRLADICDQKGDEEEK